MDDLHTCRNISTKYVYMNIKVFLDMSPYIWCTVTYVSEKLAAKDSWTEAGGTKLLHMLYQTIWRHVLTV